MLVSPFDASLALIRLLSRSELSHVWQPIAHLRLSCHARLIFCLQAPPVALRSVLEGEIRAFAAHQGVDGHRQCMRKFLELLLARGDLHVLRCIVHLMCCQDSVGATEVASSLLPRWRSKGLQWQM